MSCLVHDSLRVWALKPVSQGLHHIQHMTSALAPPQAGRKMESAQVIRALSIGVESDQLSMPHDQAGKNSNMVSAAADDPITAQEIKRRSETQDITGKRLIYSYENGWLCEIYLKNSTTMDYRIHSGPVARRWVKNQKVNVVKLSGKERFKISWCEPTGTTVSLCTNLDTRQHHGVVFFPQWVHLEGTKTALYQNNHLDEMMRLRDAGPTYPIFVVDEFAEMVLVEDAGVDDEQVISKSPTEFAPTLDQICEQNDLAFKLSHFGEAWGSRDTSPLVGKHLVYSYQNGWHHELYVRSASSIDYKIRSSLGAAWHLAKGQEAFIVRLTGSNRYIVSWTDLSGVSVSLTLDLHAQELHGVHFVPRWVLTDSKDLRRSLSKRSDACQSPLPQKDDSHGLAIVDQESVLAYREAGPTYPLQIVSEFADISSVRECGAENDSVIN